MAAPFIFIFVFFNTVDSKQKFADDWIWTADLWCW